MNQNFQRSALFNVEVVYVPIGNPAFWLVSIFEASYRTVVTWVSKKSSANQSELEKSVVSDCKKNSVYVTVEWIVNI